VQRIWKAISEETGRHKTLLPQDTVIKTLNRMMIGWSNYFCLGPVSKAYRAIEEHARKRLRQWLRAKHKLRTSATKIYPDAVLHEVLGLVQLNTPTGSFPGRPREPFSESRMRETCLSGSMSGNRKQRHVKPDAKRKLSQVPPGGYRHCAL
jgi:hypothetical protein